MEDRGVSLGSGAARLGQGTTVARVQKGRRITEPLIGYSEVQRGSFPHEVAEGASGKRGYEKDALEETVLV